MLGFMPFAGAPFGSVGSGAIVAGDVSILGEAIISAYANANWKGNASILCTAEVEVAGGIAGIGWVRQNPDTPEWDITQSSDWNKIN